jgi:ribosome assembly protein SQT1
MHTDNEHNGGDTEDYIHPDDVLVEVEDDDGGDGQPMDDDEGEDDAGEAEEEQEADDMLGDMPGTMPGALPPDVAPDTSVTRFTQHASSVFTVATHPHAPLAVSGAGDDRGYVWDIMDGTPLAMLAGHTDSVTGVAFSSDGAMVATGGMDGNVRVWRATDEGWRTWEFLVELKGPDEVMVSGLAWSM